MIEAKHDQHGPVQIIDDHVDTRMPLSLVRHGCTLASEEWFHDRNRRVDSERDRVRRTEIAHPVRDIGRNVDCREVTDGERMTGGNRSGYPIDPECPPIITIDIESKEVPPTASLHESVRVDLARARTLL
jgi:hypothetical protein